MSETSLKGSTHSGGGGREVANTPLGCEVKGDTEPGFEELGSDLPFWYGRRGGDRLKWKWVAGR